MLDKKYDYSYEGNNFYCYENSSVLINKLGIKDEDKYYSFERAATSARQAYLNDHPLDGNLDFIHLKKIHGYLLQNVFYWVGKIRTVNIAKMDLFCLCNFIDSYASEVFGNLKRDNYLQNLDKDTFIVKLADLLSDINALHHFREGNGRTQREFIKYAAALNGYALDYSLIDKDENIIASHEGINGNNDKLVKIIHRIIKPLSSDEMILFSKLFKNI